MKPIVSLLVAALACACRLSADTTAPTLVSASLTPHSVDITGATQTVTATFHVTDAESGYSYGNAYLYDQSGKFVYLAGFGPNERISGDSADGTYRLVMPVSRYSAPGAWQLHAWISDNAGNKADFNPDSLPFPVPADVALSVVNNGIVDTTAPTLDSISVTPQVVDVTQANQVVAFTVGVSDSLAGFDYGFVTVARQGYPDIYSAFGSGELTSGDASSGEYHVSVTIPQGTIAGEWHYKVSLKDKAGNNYDSISDGTLTIVSNTQPGDTTAPTLVSASLTPHTVDITGGTQMVTATFHITDAESGYSYGNAYLFDEGGKFVYLAGFGTDERISGDSADGTYSIVMPVSRYSAPGTWHLEIWIDDHAGNKVDFNPHALAFPVPADVALTVVNSGDVDTIAPTLDSISVTPEEVDVTNQDQLVNFTLTVSDALAGFDFGFITVARDGYPDFSRYVGNGERVSGDAISGEYHVPITITKGTAAGEWHYKVSLKDKAGNSYDSISDGTLIIDNHPPASVPNFLGQAVDAVQFPWSTSGGGWIMESVDTYDDVDAARTLPIPDNGTATIKAKVTGPGNLSFMWRVSSEENADFLKVSVDGGTPVQTLSGDTGWIKVIMSLPVGQHTVAWTYSKDENTADFEDRAYLDQVRFLREEDMELPVLQSLEISPRMTDLTNGTRDVDFKIAVTDDFNGLRKGRLEIYDPAGNQRVSTSFYDQSGDSMVDGSWTVTLTLPEDAEFGKWRAEIELTEDGSNAVRRYGPGNDSFPGQQIESFYAGDPNAADTEAPVLQELSVTPGVVDITTGIAKATVTLRVTDPIRGFNYGMVPVYNPNANWTGAYYFYGSDRISGDEHNGIYQIEVSIPAKSKPGKWTVGTGLQDNAGNWREYPYDLNFPADVDPSFTVTNSGPADVQNPVITAINISPSVVDPIGGPVNVQLTVNIQDDLSGILQAFVYFYNPADDYQGNISGDLLDHRISGDELAGVYQVTKSLPQGSAAGQWRVRVYLVDKAGNNVFYGKDAANYPNPSDGTFTVLGSVFANYVGSFGLAGNNALPDADPDQDGVNNALETLLGSNPKNAASTGAGLISTNRDANAFYLNFTIAAGLAATPDGVFLNLADGSGRPPFRVTGQTNVGLMNPWIDVLPEHVSGQNYRIALPFANGSKGFARLHFEDP